MYVCMWVCLYVCDICIQYIYTSQEDIHSVLSYLMYREKLYGYVANQTGKFDVYVQISTRPLPSTSRSAYARRTRASSYFGSLSKLSCAIEHPDMPRFQPSPGGLKLQLQKSPMSTPTRRQLKLTYLDMKGVAEAIRLALFIGRLDFEDVRMCGSICGSVVFRGHSHSHHACNVPSSKLIGKNFVRRSGSPTSQRAAAKWPSASPEH